MAPTLKDIAESLGISYATVSFALKGDTRIAERTRKRVREAAARLNYVPNTIAKALQSNKSLLIGCLMSDVRSSYTGELLQGIGEVAAGRGYGMLLGLVQYSPEHADEQLSTFLAKRVDGVIASWVTPRARARFHSVDASGTPVVACSTRSFGKGIPYVINDDLEGGQMAVRHLVELGHTAIAYGFATHDDDLRLKGCRKAAAAAGLQAPATFKDENDLSLLLDSGARPTAIVAYSDHDAIKVRHLLAGRGLRVPGDMSLIGFDDIWTVSLPEFDFSTIAIQKLEIGRQTAEMLLDRIDGKAVKNRRIMPEVKARGSTAKTLRGRAEGGRRGCQ